MISIQSNLTLWVTCALVGFQLLAMRALECWCGQRCECKREPASASGRNAPDPRSCLRIINHSAASPPSLLGPQTYIYRSVVRPTCGRRAMLLLRTGAGPSRSYGHGLINQSIKLLLQAAWPIKTHKKTKKKGTHTHTHNYKLLTYTKKVTRPK